jgi:hypothetical protein
MSKDPIGFVKEPVLPGMPTRSETVLTQREQLTTAVVALHRALEPLTEMLDSKASVSMRFKVAGDTIVVQLKPGPPNDGGLR